MTGIGWSCSAHAKDIWTTSDAELSRKLAAMAWAVTCTRAGFERLRALASPPDKVHLSYHGLDLERFGKFTGQRPARDGRNPSEPVVILSVGRAVEKKGYPVLLEALARLPCDLAWRFVHIGGGELLGKLRAQADELGIADRISWKGGMAQDEVLARYRQADIFALACRISGDGDRDGLPNVLMEAQSQGVACISTNISAIPELIEDGETGILVPPQDPAALASAIERLCRSPEMRQRIGLAGRRRVEAAFSHEAGLDRLMERFRIGGLTAAEECASRSTRP
jgi:glycosyltransferase involved in cell wall biosynthesis